MEYQLNFRKILDALIARFYIILLAALAALGVSFLLTDSSAPNTYSASTTIYSASYISYRDSIEGRNAINFYVDIVRSRKVAERASSLLSREIPPERIMSMVTSSFSDNSTILIIRAVSPNPDTAVAVANAVAAAFIQEVVSVTATEGAKILDTANYASLYSSGSRSSMQIRTVAALGGILVSFFIIVCFAAFDNRAAFHQEVTLNGEIELIGTIPSRSI